MTKHAMISSGLFDDWGEMLTNVNRVVERELIDSAATDVRAFEASCVSVAYRDNESIILDCSFARVPA